MGQRDLPVLKRLLTNPKDAEKLILAQCGLLGHRRLLTYLEGVSEKLTMRRRELSILRRLLTNPEHAENLIMIRRQFGAESLHLRPRQFLLLPLSALELWMSSSKIVARSYSWLSEMYEAQRPIQSFLTAAKVKSALHSTTSSSKNRSPFSKICIATKSSERRLLSKKCCRHGFGVCKLGEQM